MYMKKILITQLSSKVHFTTTPKLYSLRKDCVFGRNDPTFQQRY